MTINWLTLKCSSALLTNYVSNELSQPTIVFDAYWTDSFAILGKVINYSGVNVNEGGALDVTPEIFTAPVDGVYEFRFNGITNWNMVDANAIRIRLTLNGTYKAYPHGENVHTHQLA